MGSGRDSHKMRQEHMPVKHFSAVRGQTESTPPDADLLAVLNAWPRAPRWARRLVAYFLGVVS